MLAIFVHVDLLAQNLPNSMVVGSVSVKIDGGARLIIEREIDNLNANPKYLSSLVTKMNLYFPIIEKVLAEEGVPDEFKYLCVQESAFNAEAVSTSNAVGFWQFKRETAQEVGMRVDGVVDERKHLAAATKGAAVYLSRSNLVLKNWISTLLSYRVGLGAVRRMTDNDWAYKNEVTVNSSTDWYVLRFLAHRHFLEKHYNQSKTIAKDAHIFEYTNSRGKNLVDIAQELEVPLSDVVINNAWLKSSSVPNDKDYIVYLPVSNQQYLDLKIKNNQKKLFEEQISVNQDIGFPVLVKLTDLSVKNEPVFYEINGKRGILAVQGDTPENIAARAGINLKRFLRYNDINENDRIIPNEVYYLKKKDRRAVVAYHTVLGYETLWKISQMYGVQLEDLMAKNRITQVQRLQKGRLLWLIETRPEGQSIQYVQSSEEKTVANVEEKLTTTPTTRQPSNQPTKKISNVTQNTQPEVTIFETKSQPNVSLISEKPIIAKAGSSTTTYPTTIPQPANKPVSTTVYNPTVVTSPSSKLNEKAVKIHIVEPKQTLFSISRMYNMSVDELYNLNDMYSGSPLMVGQSISVYQSSSTPITGAVERNELGSVNYAQPNEIQVHVNKDVNSSVVVREIVTTPVENTSVTTSTSSETPLINTPSSTPTTVVQSSSPPTQSNKPFTPVSASAKPIYKIIHTIQAGETIYRVSKLYNVTVDNLKQWNNLVENTVEIGQELIIIGGITKATSYTEPNPTKWHGSTTISSSSPQYHVLQTGETVFRLSKLYGVTVEEIVKWNNIKNFTVIVGQRLVVKK